MHSLLAQPAHTGAHRSAHAWSCRGLYGRVVVVAPGCVAGAGCRVVGAASAVSQYAVSRTWLPCPGLAVLYCNTAQPFSLSPCHNTPRCIAIQPCLLQPFQPACHDTIKCIMTCLLPSPSHNTVCVLRYTPQPNLVASVTIQNLYRDTLPSAQPNQPLVTIQ